MSVTVARQMVGAEILKLRKNRGVMAFAGLLSVGVVAIVFGYNAIQHASSPQQHGPAGGLFGFNHAVRFLGLFFGTLVAAIVGTEAGTADSSNGVFRDLVATGRSRLALFAVRFPGALIVTVAFTGAAFVLAIVLSFIFAGGTATPDATLIVKSAGWILLCNAAVVAVALGIGSIGGSRAVTLTGVIGWQFVATQLLTHVSSLGSVRDVLLTPAMGHLAPVPVGDVVSGVAMGTGLAVLVTCCWLILPLIGGLWRTDTVDA
jgi:ABC-type transport system involved in multi-copper enzyme maturation permease subunit